MARGQAKNPIVCDVCTLVGAIRFLNQMHVGGNEANEVEQQRVSSN